MIWAKEETIFRAKIESVQLTRLKGTVKRAYEEVPAYRAKMEAAGIQPDDIQTLKDLQKLLFTIKQDTRDSHLYGLSAVPRKGLLKIHASSGTMEKPTVVGYTQNDLNVWRECVACIAAAGGVTDKNVTQTCFGHGMFTRTLGLHSGLEKMGAVIASSSMGGTQKQLMYMKDSETTPLVATPSYAMRTAEVALEMSLDPKKDLKIKGLVLGSEPMTEVMRNGLYKIWGENVNLTQNYSMSEPMGLGVSRECLELSGMHINEDHFIVEAIDPKTGQVLPVGEKDELVITCITKEALPLIRYRTRDTTGLMYEPCPCGYTIARIESLSGRTDGMLKTRGVNIFSSQIEEVSINTNGIGPNYEILVDRENHSDLLTIKVEVEAESMMGSYAALEKLDQNLREKIRMMLGLDAKIQFVSPNTLQRFEEKIKRVADLGVGRNEV